MITVGAARRGPALARMAQPTIAADPLVRWRGLTRAQYEALVEAGLLDGEPVELLEGVLVDVVPRGALHARTLRALNRYLVTHVPDPWLVSVQVPLAATAASEPEPDLAVVTEAPSGHPTTAALVIEVAVTSQRTDLAHEPGVYAAAGVEQYWVLDLPRRQVVVHTGSGPEGYAEVRRLPWSTPLAVLGVAVDLAPLLGADRARAP